MRRARRITRKNETEKPAEEGAREKNATNTRSWAEPRVGIAENTRGNKDGAWKREEKEEEGKNQGRTKTGVVARLEKRPEKKEAGCAGIGNVAQAARKCTEIVEGAKEETAARHFPRKPINKKVAQIRALYSQEGRKKGRETEEQRRQRSGGHVASRRPENTGRGSMYPSSSSYDIDNSYVARNTRLYIPFDIQPFRRSLEHVSSLYSASLSLFPYFLRREQRRCTYCHIYKNYAFPSNPAASRNHRVSSSWFAFFLRFSTCPRNSNSNYTSSRNSCIFFSVLSESY